MMSRFLMPLAFALSVAPLSPALAQSQLPSVCYIPSDQLPYGPAGTIGGAPSDTNDMEYMWEQCRLHHPELFYEQAQPAARPYPTYYYYTAPDGYRYQLYFDPTTGTYLYYPRTHG